MPKQFRRKKKPKRAGTDSLSRDIHQIAKKTNLLKQKSGSLARQSQALQEGAHKAHKDIEHIHYSLDEAHEVIKEIEEKEISKGQGAPGQKTKTIFRGRHRGFGGRFLKPSRNCWNSFRRRPAWPSCLCSISTRLIKSNLTTLLSRSTHIEVTEIRHHTQLVPNHVYVIPPNAALSISEGVLQLTPRKKVDHYLPIDNFFPKSRAGPGQSCHRHHSFG